MKESQIRRHLDYIYFVQETEDYPMTPKAEAYTRDVLDDDLAGDEAVSMIIDEYGLSANSDTSESPDGLYAGSEVFINYLGLRDQQLLDEIETQIVSVRMAELLKGDFEGPFDFDYLKVVHHHLFSDLYPFAGEQRYVSINQRAMFCLPQYIGRMAEEIFTKLREDNYLKHQEFEEFVDNLAYYMAEIHALHPFLDGNTRTMRIFFHQLAKRAGWRINPSDTNETRLLEADIAALEGDYQPLIGLLHTAVEPIDS
ncbi:MAG: Fic/DOC family protein [Sphaerochaetaceae bacterium]